LSSAAEAPALGGQDAKSLISPFSDISSQTLSLVGAGPDRRNGVFLENRRKWKPIRALQSPFAEPDMPTTTSSDERTLQRAISRRNKENASFVEEKAREERVLATDREKNARMISRARAKQDQRYRKMDEKTAQKAAHDAANPTYGRSGVKHMDTIEAQHWEFRAVAATQRVQAVGLVVLGGAAMGLSWHLFDRAAPLVPSPSTAQVAMDFAQFAGHAMVGSWARSLPVVASCARKTPLNSIFIANPGATIGSAQTLNHRPNWPRPNSRCPL